MKTFIKDYANLCEVTGKFYKDHWLGVVVINVVAGAAGGAYIFKDDIKKKVKTKFKKKA